MDDPGREALHGSVVHRSQERCPIEAAEEATFLRADMQILISAVLLLWIVTITVALIAPHWTLRTPERPAERFWFLFAVCSTVLTVMFSRTWLSVSRKRREAERAASKGPDLDPWELARSWPGRRPKPPTPRPEVHPVVWLTTLAVAVLILLATHSWLGATVVAAWAGYTISILRNWVVSLVHRHHQDPLARPIDEARRS
jgi:MFS superfamily sulfate permease-like transporter